MKCDTSRAVYANTCVLQTVYTTHTHCLLAWLPQLLNSRLVRKQGKHHILLVSTNYCYLDLHNHHHQTNPTHNHKHNFTRSQIQTLLTDTNYLNLQ